MHSDLSMALNFLSLGFLCFFHCGENETENQAIEKPRFYCTRPEFLKLWSADHKWSSGSALVVLLD
jgi:hypothetical protein